MKYLYFLEARLQNDVTDCCNKFVRRELDSDDLLEEIIAKERLNFFYQIEDDIVKILNMTTEESPLNFD